MIRPFLKRAKTQSLLHNSMPNLKGGKGYKKGKKENEEELDMLECNAADGQMFGRVVKVLGNKRFLVYCNDNMKRICRICGSMRKSEWIEKGCIVLISIRPVSTILCDVEKEEKGDIIGLLDPSLVGKLKKDLTVNAVLFAELENMNDAGIIMLIKGGITAEDDMFEREGEEDEEEGEEGIELVKDALGGGGGGPTLKPEERLAAMLEKKLENKERGQKVANDRRKKEREITMDEL